MTSYLVSQKYKTCIAFAHFLNFSFWTEWYLVWHDRQPRTTSAAGRVTAGRYHEQHLLKRRQDGEFSCRSIARG